MQIPILLGRGMEARDLQSPRVAVVSEQFAKQFFPNQSPVGQRIGLGDAKNPADIEIVGIARNSRYNDLKHENPPVVYVPFTQDVKDLGRVAFELRTAGNPLALANTVRGIVHEANAAVPVSDVGTQSATIDQTISQERTFADLCTCFALLALLIACVGLYGTMAYAVARRTSEIGIRMALGAERRRIIWMVLREVLALGTVGLALGLLAAWQTSHLVKAFLFGVTPNDPVALAGSVAVLVSAAVIAGYAPAWRASRIDPIAALRHE
jgi:predicted permease